MSRLIFSSSVVPLVCWSVATSRSSGSVCIFARIFGAHSFSSARLASCSVNSNWVRVGRPPSRTSCAACMIEPGALDLVELGAQPGDDLLRGRLALVARLQRDEHVAVVAGPAAAADIHGDGRDIRVGHHDLAEFLLMPLHVGEGNILAGLGCRGDQADVLLREEAFRDDHEQIDRQSERREEDHQRREFPAQRQIEAALIGAKHGVERAFAPLVEAAVPGLADAPAGSARPSSASASATRSSRRRSSSPA